MSLIVVISNYVFSFVLLLVSRNTKINIGYISTATVTKGLYYILLNQELYQH